MRRNGGEKSWCSLAQYFKPPEGHIGYFGWIIGYSADPGFLNSAVERFSQLTSAQRAHQGRLYLAVMLDAGNPIIPYTAAAGVAHLPMHDSRDKEWPFRLLHAKIAILGFRHIEKIDKWCLRIVVSTGNWTRQTLEESIDLAWCVEVESDDLLLNSNEITRIRSDIAASVNFRDWLMGYFDDRLLNHSSGSGVPETVSVVSEVNSWIKKCATTNVGSSRIFDNRFSSLNDQLPKMIIEASGTGGRNYLAMGSGFYESVKCGGTPIVPKEIMDSLKINKLLTKTSEVDLFVNEKSCQSVAHNVGNLIEQGITIRPAYQNPLIFGQRERSLHAKFLFGAKEINSSKFCLNAWVYLGSGNLTGPGFINRMNKFSGNLEIGVVFNPGNVVWGKDEENENGVVTDMLPIEWETEYGLGLESLSAGSDMEDRELQFLPPPVAWLIWSNKENGSELMLPSGESHQDTFHILDSRGNICGRTKLGFKWNEPQPRQVACRWQTGVGEMESLLPVIDKYGRIAATELPKLNVDEAQWQLTNFPNPPDNELDDEITSDFLTGGHHVFEKVRSSLFSDSYPIRRMMALVESIAEKQTSIAESDWDLWCRRLEQILVQTKDSTTLQTFHKLGLNPLSPLWHQVFRPSFAEDSTAAAGKAYEKTLKQIEKCWEVEDLEPLGGNL